jgi:hypothetical protein
VVTLYFAVHSTTVAAAAWGMPAFVRATSAVGTARAIALGVLAFLLMLADRVEHVREARRVHDSACALREGFGSIATSLVTISWLAGQLWTGVYAFGSYGVPAEYRYTELMAQLSSTGVAGVPWVALGQVVALAAVAFFLLSRAALAATQRIRIAVVVAGAVAVLFPLNGVLYMATGSRAFGPSHLTLDVPTAPCGSAR